MPVRPPVSFPAVSFKPRGAALRELRKAECPEEVRDGASVVERPWAGRREERVLSKHGAHRFQSPEAHALAERISKVTSSEEAGEILDKVPEERIVGAVLLLHEAKGAWRKALSFFNEMRKGGDASKRHVSLSLCNAVLRACQHGAAHAALELVAWMESEAIQPDAYTMVSAMAACTNARKAAVALDLYDRVMPRASLTVTTQLIGAALTASMHTAQHTRATDLLDHLECVGLRPTPGNYSLAVEACCRARTFPGAV
eukprot:Hpha_TRINITY_DN19979_c0_g1::TRINITY_DN19979_c0_g1_i1::g.93649::m.93649